MFGSTTGAVALILSLAAGVGDVQGPPKPPPQVTVYAMEQGKPAPFPGFLLTEARFLAYVKQQEELEKAEARAVDLEKSLRSKVTEAEQCRLTCAPSKDRFWFGVVTGGVVTVLVTGAVVYAGWGAVRALR